VNSVHELAPRPHSFGCGSNIPKNSFCLGGISGGGSRGRDKGIRDKG